MYIMHKRLHTHTADDRVCGAANKSRLYIQSEREEGKSLQKLCWARMLPVFRVKCVKTVEIILCDDAS